MTKIKTFPPYAERIGGQNFGQDQAVYKFERIKRAKQAAKLKSPELKLLDLGIGEPDSPADFLVVKALADAASLKENRGYADNGGQAFKEAAAHYMKQIFGVQLCPETEVLHSIGSKAALTLLPAAFINPGDLVLSTCPGYTVFSTHARYYGGIVHELPLLAKNNFLPDLNALPNRLCEQAKVFVLNYPNNPTGALAQEAFFEQLIEWAEKWNVLIIHDAAYASLVYEGEPLSILKIPRAKKRCLELHSLSKTFNMTGWRLGWVCGAKELIQAYAHVKDHSDSGQFLAIQAAGALALSHPEITQKTGEKYRRRLTTLASLLNKLGFCTTPPKAGFFLYVQSPKSAETKTGKVDFANAEAFSTWLIQESSICTIPWDEAGHFVRFSVTFEAESPSEEQAFFKELSKRLENFHFGF